MDTFTVLMTFNFKKSMKGCHPFMHKKILTASEVGAQYITGSKAIDANEGFLCKKKGK